MEYLTKDDFDDIDYIIDHYKYKSLNEYVESNIENLKNHKINEENIYELSHLILLDYVSYRDSNLRDQVEKIYNDLFTYAFKSYTQEYYDISRIHSDISMLEFDINEAKKKNIYNETIEFIRKIAHDRIEYLVDIYAIDHIIISEDIFEEFQIEKLFDYGYYLDIIRKYAKNESIRVEYCDQEE